MGCWELGLPCNRVKGRCQERTTVVMPMAERAEIWSLVAVTGHAVLKTFPEHVYMRLEHACNSLMR